MKMTKVEKSWILFDVGNSAYATIMIAAVYPIYFTKVCQTAGVAGDFWWGIGTSIATAVVAVLAPIIGAIADVWGVKKKLFSGFLLLGLVFSLVNMFTSYWQLMLIGYIFSYIGFLGSALLNDSFLTDVTTPERMDSVSSWAYGLGYIGGSTIPFLMSIFLIVFGNKFGVDGVLAVKLSLLIMVVWWAVFSIPYLKNVEQKYGVDKPQKNFVVDTFKRVFITAKKIFTNKPLFAFVLAYFFYIDGVNTVINMATSYGSAIGLDSTGMILALLVTQIVAFPCAIIFGNLSRKFGSINMIMFATVVYLIICLLGFIMGFGLEEGFMGNAGATKIFWTLSVLVGSVQGGIQAISRSYFGKLVPPENSGEYFGFFDIFGKFAAVIGPMLYSLSFALSGRSSFSILSIILLFLVGLGILLANRKILQAR